MVYIGRMLTYQQLKDQPRDFLAATGLMVAEFERLLPAYQTAYERRYPQRFTLAGKVRQRQPGGGSKGMLDQAEDRLLFILIYLKTNPLQTMHGLQFGLSQPQTNYWIHHLLPVVQAALQELDLTLEHDGSQVATSPLALAGTPDLALDGTERRHQRPQDPAEQRAHYSGEKKEEKTHTDKNIVLVNESTNKVILSGSDRIREQTRQESGRRGGHQLPGTVNPRQRYGFSRLRAGGRAHTPAQKKPHSQGLRRGRQIPQSVIASVRIEVDYVLAGIKRCRIVKDVLRLTKEGVSDLVMVIACGLHNNLSR